MKPKQAPKRARKLSPSAWLYAGGGGNEVEKGDEKALTVTWYGLVAYLDAYRRYLETP